MSDVLGIDVGTSTVCGVAVGTGGELIAAAEKANDSAVAGLPAGRFEQDPGRIHERVVEVLAELAVRAGEVACIGLTGQMHGMLCVDERCGPVSNLITWQDQRCLDPTPQGRSVLDQMLQAVPGNVWNNCGCRPASGFMGSTLFWLCRNNALPPGTKRVSFIHDWVGATLTGQLPVTDPGDAGSSGIFDLANQRWHDGIIRALALPAQLLPPLRESGQVVGPLCRGVATLTGLKSGTPVCNALGDNQASVIGSIAEPERSVLVNLGTGGQISWAIPSFRRVEGMETRYLPGGRFMLVGASLCGGRAFAWLNDVVRVWLKDFGAEASREDVYGRLTSLAMRESGAGGPVVRTTFAGTRVDPSLRGVIESISLENFSLGRVSRAVLNGMVEELCVFYDSAGAAKEGRRDTVVASGNAVRKNPLLKEIIRSRLGHRVLIPEHREEAAFGAALVAGVGAGVWPSLEEAGRCIRYQAGD
jgi:sugar (pentulose or hexulose) kinase